MPYYNLLLVALMLPLSGCIKRVDDAFVKEGGYHQKLIKTEKFQRYHNGQTTLLVTATYLGEEKHSERFIIGLYRDEGIEAIPGTPTLKLTLNGTPPQKLTKLSQETIRPSELPLQMVWMDYYMVTFPHTDTKTLHLQITTPHLGSGTLQFAKVAKYMLHPSTMKL